MSATVPGPDGRPRCRWGTASPAYLQYHDTEWGFPVDDDRRLFEKLSLEGFQAGLSWRTILDKRENFRAAFAGFDFDKVAEFTGGDVERLLQDAGIVRHRGKIEAVINNARRARELVEREGSLAAFVWRYEPEPAALGAAGGLDLGGVDRAVEGAEAARLGLRRADDGLCLHAGDGARQRPRGRLRDPGRGRARPRRLRPAGLRLRRCSGSRARARRRPGGRAAGR